MRVLVTVAILALCAKADAKVITKAIEYKHGNTVLEGMLAYDDERTGKRPGVLVVHEWWGCNDYSKDRARQLAELGYVAFACDMFGKGIMTDDAGKAGQLAGQFKNDIALMRARAQAGLDVLARDERVDTKRIGAIGFCFGGTTVLQLAFGGADLAGVVSFHGGVGAMTPAAGKRVTARLLVLHGADDPFIPATDIVAFQDSLRDANADWQMVYYGRAVHSFSNKAATGAIKGAEYDEAAARRSWQHMKIFFDEVFATGAPTVGSPPGK